MIEHPLTTRAFFLGKGLYGRLGMALGAVAAAAPERVNLAIIGGW